MFAYTLMGWCPVHAARRFTHRAVMQALAIRAIGHARRLHPPGECDRHFRHVLLPALPESCQELSVMTVQLVEREPLEDHAISPGPVVQFQGNLRLGTVCHVVRNMCRLATRPIVRPTLG